MQEEFSIFPVITSLCVPQSAPTEIAVCFKIFACAGFRLKILKFLYSNFFFAK